MGFLPLVVKNSHFVLLLASFFCLLNDNMLMSVSMLLAFHHSLQKINPQNAILQLCSHFGVFNLILQFLSVVGDLDIILQEPTSTVTYNFSMMMKREQMLCILISLFRGLTVFTLVI